MTPDLWTRLRPNEISTLREHLIRISDRDRDKRKRAMREYRTWLDYLVDLAESRPRSGRI